MIFSPKNSKTKKIQNGFKSFFLLSFFIVSFSLVGFFIRSEVLAATGINKQISFQGKVVNNDGTNVTNGSYTFLFCLYTVSSPSTACTSGANNDAVWRESKSLTVTDGIFQTNLGDTTSLPGSVDFNTDNIYLGVNFNSDGQMSPLVRFTAAPYAMSADKVHGLTVTDTTGTLTIPNSKTISFADAFTTSGAFPLTLTSTASTTATLPSGTITLVDLATSQSLTNKTIGSTGLTFSGATTDITTGTNEDLTLVANGSGTISLNDTVSVASTLTLSSISGSTQCLHVNSSGVVSGTGSDCGSGSGTDLQTSYNADADGSNTTISLTTADDSLIFTNPSSSGTDSAFLLQLSQANTTAAVVALDIIQSSNAANGLNLTANAIDTETGLAITTNALTSGSALSLSSSVAANFTGSLASINLSDGTGAASNTGSLLTLTNAGTANANTALYVKHYATGSNNLAMRVDDVSGDTTPFVIDGNGNVGIGNDTSPVALLTIGASDVFQVNSSGAIAAATGITSSGTITFSGFTTNGGLLYTNGSGVLAQTGAGTSTTVLHGGTTPSYGAVALGTDTSGNYVASANTSVLTGLTGGSAGSVGAALTLGFDYSATLAANLALSASTEVFGTTGLIFEGATPDTVELLLTAADPTASDKTLTLPNLTGTIATIDGGQTFTSATWNGTAIGAQYGGTGLNTSASTGVPYISSGTWSVDATQLAVAHGGTNASSVGSAGSVAYSTGSAYAFSAVGTAGQALVSGGTGAPTFFAPTAGSVVFAGTSGILQQDNASFFFDDTNNRLGLGTTSPAAQLSIFGTTNAIRLSYDVSNYSSISAASDGTLSLTSSNTSESQFVIGTGASVDDAVAFDGASQDYYAGLDHATGYFTIGTGFTVGASTLLAIDSTGNVGIGTGVTAPGARLDIAAASTSTTGASEYSLRNTFSDTGVVTTGTDTTYGNYTSLTRTGATGGTINSYGNYTTLTNTFASGSGTTSGYGNYTTATGNTNGSSSLYGAYVNVTGADNTYGIYSNMIGTTGASSYGLVASITDTTTGANINYGSDTYVSDSGIVTTGTDTTTGANMYVERTGATGGTIDTYGLNMTVATDNAGAGTATAYGINIDTNTSSSANADTVYGLKIATEANASTTAYGLYVDAGAAAGTEYAATFLNGNVGVGDATPDALLDLDFSQTSGTLLGITAPAGVTLAGNLTGQNIDVSTNVTATGRSVTGSAVTLPAATNTGGSNYNYIGYQVSGGNLIQSSGAGSNYFVGNYITNPNITQTAGAVTAWGTYIATGTITTAGVQTGVNIAATGVGAGTLKGIDISAITAGAGTETAIAVGSGWDTLLDTATLDITGGGAITGATGITSSGTITFSSISGSTQCLHVNSSGVVSGTGSDCGSGSGTSLDAAYTTGNTITTDSGSNVIITLQEVVTPTSFVIENQDTAGVNAERIFNSIASGTLTNGLLIEQTGAGTMTNGIQIAETAGTIGDGIFITGTLGNILNSPSLDITGAGAITGATGITSATGDITATAGNVAITAGVLTLNGTTRISNAGVGTFITGTVIGSQTFTTNNIADSGALTIASGSGTALTLNSGTTGTINIGTDASAETINIGNTGAAVKSILIGNNSQANTITIGDASVTSLSITENNWSISTAGAAAFASLSSSGAIAANGGITFDNSTDTLGAFTLAGTLDANSNIITNIGATTTDFTTSGSLAIGLDAADTNGALMVDNVAQANPIIVAKDNGTIVWQVGDGGLLTIDPVTTGTIENYALATQWTTGTIWNAAFGSATTQTGAIIGTNLDFNTNFTAVAGSNLTGFVMKYPQSISLNASTETYTGIELGTTSGAFTKTGSGTFTSNGLLITTPAATQTAGTVAVNGVAMTISALTTGGTADGVKITPPASTGAGTTTNGVELGTITTSNGTDTAFKVGTGWDTILGGTTAGTNLIGFTNFTVTSAGVGTFASTLNANGGIAFDASTDTIGAFTSAGTIDMSTQILTNIGNTGTDFVASTGALTLAGVLTANGGIGLAGSQSFTASALAYMDLGSITHNTTAVQGLRLPQAASSSPSSPVSGEGYLAWDAGGNQVIYYNGTAWATFGAGGGYATIKDETTGLTQRTTLAFLGAGVSCADNVTQTECTISGGGSADLQATYGSDADGSNATISLTAADDGLVFTNPTSGGTDGSAFLLALTQQNTTAAVVALDITQSSNAANGANLTANSIDTETGLAITANGLTSGKGLSIDSSSAALTGALATVTLTGNNASNTGDLLYIQNTGASNAIDGLHVDNAGSGSAINIGQSGSGNAILANHTGTGNLVKLQTAGVDKVTFGNNGALTINGTDSSIVRNTTTEFAVGTVGSNLTNSSNRVQLSDGSPANSGQGTITTSSQPATPSNIGAGAMSISRPNGKYLIINGGSTGTTQIYDSFAGTITASQTITCNGTTTVGVGSIALPRSNGLYTIICGVAASTTTATSTLDPQGAIGSRIGPALATAVTGAGTVAYKRPDGKYLVTIGASTPGSATNIYDPVADTFVAGPAAASGTWTTGSLAIPMPDGRALIVNGGSTSTTNIYNPNGVSATIGTFTVGPSLDGVKTAGTCGINGSGSVALKRQDGKYVILSKASVYALFDPSAMTMTCNSSVSNVSALGDGAHAIPIQNGKFLIFAGGNTTTAFVYNPDSDSFSTYSGTAPTAITTGAHSLLRQDGKWQIITGTNTCTNGCTNSFDTSLPMSDPFPSAPLAGAPSAGGSCDAGTHSYYVTFITNSVESELSQKSNIVSCTAGSGTVALSGIPLGPAGTTARKIYRTTAGDAAAPKLLNTTGSCSTAGGGSGITDNTSTTCSDTTADASLGSTYSVTAAGTWYTSEDISSSYLGIASTIRWTAQLEATYAAMSNGVTNTAFRTVQFFVKTAVNNSGCASPLAAAPWQEIQSSGDAIRTAVGANCVKVSIHFNRAMPKKLYDDRGTWTGNNTTVLRYDYTTPTLFDYSIDNSAVMKRTAWDFVDVTSNQAPFTVPSAPTSAAPGGSGSCTSGNHFWFVTFVISGIESPLSAASTVQSCSGSNAETLTIPTGPSGTTARKIYRTAAGFLVTDTPFLVGTQSDNSTTSYVDNLADSSLGAAYVQLTPSGPTLSRAEGSRVETSNNQLTLPWGRITPTTLSASGAGIGQAYMGVFGSDHPTLNNTAGPGTFVIARDDKTFLVVEGGSTTAELYDPATQTFTNQTATGDKPTATVGVGAFAIKRPNGKFLVILGNNTTTTNIYDQYAPPGSRFTAGPALTGTAAHQGAFAMQNADGTWTILPGNAATSTSIYDPVRNTMTVGPLQTTATNFGALAIPLQGPNGNIYKVINGTTVGGAVATTTMNYNANTKIFTAGQALAVGVGNGATAFQRQDGYWVLLRGESAANTLGTTVGIINPVYGTEVAGTALAAAVNGRGTTVIPRADGTFLITSGNSLAAATTPGSSVLTVIYFPWGGASGSFSGTPVAGFSAAGPAMPFQGTQSTAITAPTTAAPASGGTNQCDTGTHLWRYTQVINGVETALSLAGTVQTCTVTTLGQESLTAIAVGPTGTSARKVYRTKAGTTSPYFLVTTINDNTTTTYADSASDASLGAQYWSGGPGDGAVSFQRPDGKFVTIYAGAPWTTPLTEIGSKMVSIYDAGWYADGQYLSEQMNVPALAANSTLEWQQTSDQFVRMAVRTASSQSALGAASYTAISNPGGSVGNAGGETWAQVQVNFRRDFPTYGYNQNGVYLGSGGGLAYTYRNISIPTVNSFQITNGMDLVTLQNDGLNVFRVTSNGSILSSSQGGFFSGGADLAENYTSSQSLEKGEVVMIDQANPEAVLRATGQYQNNIIGVVSTKPGFVAGGYTDNSYPIALVGRVPVRVSTENGPIQAGDTLTSASIPGYAMKATLAGRSLGRALEAFDPATAAPCPSQGMGNFLETKCGSIMMFVNLANYYGAPIELAMSDEQLVGGGVDGGLDASAPQVENDGLLTSAAVRLAVSIPSKEQAMLEYLKRLHDSRVVSGAPSSEVLADRISATGEIISPTIIADTIFAKHIKADQIEGLQVFTDALSSLSEKYAGLSAPVTSDPSQTPVAEQRLAVAMKNLSVDTLAVQLDGSILGKLTVAGALQIGGAAQFDGDTVFSKLANFLGDTFFHGNVAFDKTPTFGTDTAGFAIIKKDEQRVHVTFEVPYPRQPIVAVTLTNDQSPLLDGETDAALVADVAAVEQDYLDTVFDADLKYVVTEKSTTGFTIVLNKKAPYELQFSWVAIAVKRATTAVSQSTEPTPEVIVPPTSNSVTESIPTPTPGVTVTEPVAPEPLVPVTPTPDTTPPVETPPVVESSQTTTP